jgi:N-acetylglucosamine-6-sulfatase
MLTIPLHTKLEEGIRMKARLLTVSIVAVLAATAGAVPTASTSSAAQQRPNVLVLMTDDQTVESVRVMANVRRLLAAEGTTFANNFVTFSLCCPSRATFLTGQYSHNNGVQGNSPPAGGFNKLDSTRTLPVWLQRADYHTVHIGKYLNGYDRTDGVPPGYSEWYGSIDPTTYRFWNYTLNENGSFVTYGTRPQDYQADVYGQKATAIVRRLAPSDQPFYLKVAFLAPHSGAPRGPDDPQGIGTPEPAPRHRNAFASEPLPQPASFNEADVSDKPVGIRNRAPLTVQQIAGIRENYQQRLESLLAVDEAIAGIVAALRASGELDKTLIIFTADNGFFHGEHRVPSGKVLLYEPSIRVPLIVRGPGVPRGRTIAEPVANIDLAPTIVDAANARADRTMDGRSLLPLLASPATRWGRDLVIENGPSLGPRGRPRVQAFAALRTPRYLYAEYGNGDRELYDLDKDPQELASKHADPAYAAIRAELAQRLAGMRGCRGAACRRVPSVALRVSCTWKSVRARVVGADARWVTRLDLSAKGRRVATDRRRPYTRVLARRTLRGSAVLHARIAFADGRVKTTSARACR